MPRATRPSTSTAGRTPGRDAHTGLCSDLMPERGLVRTSGASQPGSRSFSRRRTRVRCSSACRSGGSAANAAAVSANEVSPFSGSALRSRSRSGSESSK